MNKHLSPVELSAVEKNKARQKGERECLGWSGIIVVVLHKAVREA